TLRRYGYADWLTASAADGDVRLRSMARQWAGEFDPLSMLALRRASLRFDIGDDLPSLSTPVLWTACTSDTLFPADALAIRAKGAPVTFVSIDGKYGHSSPLLEAGLWQDAVSGFLAGAGSA